MNPKKINRLYQLMNKINRLRQSMNKIKDFGYLLWGKYSEFKSWSDKNIRKILFWIFVPFVALFISTISTTFIPAVDMFLLKHIKISALELLQCIGWIISVLIAAIAAMLVLSQRFLILIGLIALFISTVFITTMNGFLLNHTEILTNYKLLKFTGLIISGLITVFSVIGLLQRATTLDKQTKKSGKKHDDLQEEYYNEESIHKFLLWFFFASTILLIFVMIFSPVEHIFIHLTGAKNKLELIQLIGWGMSGIIALIGVIGFLRRAAALDKQNEITERGNKEQHDATEKGHIHERFKTATEHLGSDHISVRIAAFYEFYRLASKEDLRQTVLDILYAHVRQTTKSKKYKKITPTEEIKILLKILFKQKTMVFNRLINHLERADLQEANLTGADLTNVDLTEAKLINANLTKADLTSAVLIDANLTSAILTKAKLINAVLTGAYLTDAVLKGADLTGAFLKGAFLTGAFLKGADLTGAFLTSTDLTKADLKGAFLIDADLTKAVLTGTDLTKADLTDADLTKADLIKAKLLKADLTNAVLIKAKLLKADLTNTVLINAVLTDAVLAGAVLIKAKLINADLTNADLTNAVLTNADLTNADLTNADLFEATIDETTIMPFNWEDIVERKPDGTPGDEYEYEPEYEPDGGYY